MQVLKTMISTMSPVLVEVEWKVTVSEALAAEGASKEQSYHSLETGRAETDKNAVD